MNSSEQIKLTLPVNAAYVSAARLTASSVANRLNFDIEEIEDIKVAVSEACTYIIKKYSSEKERNFKIEFTLSNDNITISISVDNKENIKIDKEEMSLLVIKALMDTTTITCDNGIFNMVISKNHVQTSFEE